MFKNMKLSTKMTLGFGAMVLIAATLSVVGWYLLNQIDQTAKLAQSADNCILNFEGVRRQEKNYMIRGDRVPAGDTKNAAQNWQEQYSKLQEQLKLLASNTGLDAEEHAFVQEADKNLGSYGQAFQTTLEARKAKDQGFADWGSVGREITASIGTARGETIEPAIKAALTEKNVDTMEHWTRIEKSLNEDVVQQFLLQRVCAVYLIATAQDVQYESYQKQLQVTQDGLSKWTQLVQGEPALENAAAAIKASLDKYQDAGKRFYQAILSERQAEAAMVTAARSLNENLSTASKELNEHEEELVVFADMFSLILTVCGVVLGVTLAIFITRSITKPINRIVAGLTEGAQQVASASGQVSAASQSLAEGATEQAAGLEETSSSLEEMSSMTKQNADNAQQANTLASEARNAAKGGAELMQKMSKAIDDIQKSSDQTAKIIKVIDEIAFQTNLLALNAAVEAARAGEAGKGFAVVAEEVRNLAMRSAEAAKNTANMIEESVKNAKNGVEISNEVSKSLEEIVNGIAKTTDLVGEIAAASSEQAQGIDQVNTAVAQMDKVTQQNAANAEESASASEELSAQAEQMQTIVNELVRLIDGANAAVQSTAAAGRTTGTAKAKAKLGLSDHTFHAIAEGKGHSTTVKTPAKQSLPLDNSGFESFNG